MPVLRALMGLFILIPALVVAQDRATLRHSDHVVWMAEAYVPMELRYDLRETERARNLREQAGALDMLPPKIIKLDEIGQGAHTRPRNESWPASWWTNAENMRNREVFRDADLTERMPFAELQAKLAGVDTAYFDPETEEKLATPLLNAWRKTPDDLQFVLAKVLFWYDADAHQFFFLVEAIAPFGDDYSKGQVTFSMPQFWVKMEPRLGNTPLGNTDYTHAIRTFHFVYKEALQPIKQKQTLEVVLQNYVEAAQNQPHNLRLYRAQNPNELLTADEIGILGQPDPEETAADLQRLRLGLNPDFFLGFQVVNEWAHFSPSQSLHARAWGLAPQMSLGRSNENAALRYSPFYMRP